MIRKMFHIACLFLIGTTASADEIRVALSGDMRSSQPGVNRDSHSDDILTHIVESLLVHRADLSIAPMAAEKYSVSKDLTTYHFTLRDGLLFHNGDKVLARHLKANWERILDPKTGFQCLPFYDGTLGPKVIRVDAPDDKTLIIQLDQPSSVFPEMLAYIQCPVAVLHPDSWDSEGNWINPIGTGPYKLKTWKKGNFILLEKFDGYVPRDEPPSGLAGAKNPVVKHIRWMVITDSMAQKAALVSGQIDLVYSVVPVSAFELRRNKRVQIMDSPGLSRRLLLMQTADPLLSNTTLRRAIAHAIDLKLFADITSFNLATPNPSVMPDMSLNHTNKHTQWHPFDPEKAAALLKKSGYKGEVITLQTTRSLAELFDVAMVAEAMLKKSGINIKVEVLEWGALIANYFKGDFQIMAFEYSPRMTAFMSYNAAVGSKKRTPYIWENAQAFDLLRAIIPEKDALKRQGMYDHIHDLMKAEVPVINLYNVPVTDAMSRRLRGYEPWPGVKPRLWNVRIAE